MPVGGKPKPSTGPAPLVPFWQTTDGSTARLYLGEVRDVLARMPERSVHCVVTSPPYWGLRQYLPPGSVVLDPKLSEVEREKVLAELRNIEVHPQ